MAQVALAKGLEIGLESVKISPAKAQNGNNGAVGLIDALHFSVPINARLVRRVLSSTFPAS